MMHLRNRGPVDGFNNRPSQLRRRADQRGPILETDMAASATLLDAMTVAAAAAGDVTRVSVTTLTTTVTGITTTLLTGGAGRRGLR